MSNAYWPKQFFQVEYSTNDQILVRVPLWIQTVYSVWPNTKQGSQSALCRAEIAHLVSSLIYCLFETFRWDLKGDMLFETFETFWILKLFKHIMESCLFETFRWDLKRDMLFETFETLWFETFETIETFQTYHGGVVYLKLSDETWKKTVIFKTFVTWNFSNFSTHHRSCLFETFRWDLKWDVLFETF